MKALALAALLAVLPSCDDGVTTLDVRRVTRVERVAVPPAEQPRTAADWAALTPQDSAHAPTPPATDPRCPAGSACAPIAIDRFPFSDTRDTRVAPADDYDAYACAPDTDEGGGEVIYQLDVTTVGVLTVGLDDRSGDAVDVDVHLMTALDPSTCVTRDNRALTWVVRPGRYYVAADTWVDDEGLVKAGEYTLTASFAPLHAGPCAVEVRDQQMSWRACAAGVDCFEAPDDDGTWRRYLRTPAWGPVVKEAHLVTTGESFDGNGWPSASRDEIERHYSLSEAATGYQMDRREPWAPYGEGGSQWGQGATGAAVPVDAEAWYINMYWRGRPAPGTRMLVLNPETGRAVVAAGGYETGPGSNTAVGGVSEEIHHHLETSHRDPLVIAFLVDQELPFGPIACD